jgi:hypothetical protein
MKKFGISIIIALVLALMLVTIVSATQPTEMNGDFYAWVPGDPDTPSVYCFRTLGPDGSPDGFLDGCVVQPYSPGQGKHGTFTGTVDGKSGTCEYNLRAFHRNDGIARFVTSQCTGELEGFHMKGVGTMIPPLWEGSYHFDP